MAAGWMGGVEFAKIMMGRTNEKAWIAGALVPAGIHGIWRRDIYKGGRLALYLGAIGYAYQYSTNHELTNTILPSNFNPNIPSRMNPMDREKDIWNLTTRNEHPTFHTDTGMYCSDSGPSWKKWEN